MTLPESWSTEQSGDVILGTCGVDARGVWLRGEHDAATVPAVSHVLAYVSGRDRRDVSVDMSEVSFLGAATVRVLMRSRQFLMQRSRRLVVVSASRTAQRTIDLCELNTVLHAGSSVGTLGVFADLPVDAV